MCTGEKGNKNRDLSSSVGYFVHHSNGEGPAIRLLLVEDDDEIAERVTRALSDAKFDVVRAADGDLGWYKGVSENIDVVVLDIGLPHMSGLDVLKKWRDASMEFPVLLLSARSSWNDRVRGLNAGADDYLAKPFYSEELVARVNALLRRGRHKNELGLTVGAFRIEVESGVAKSGTKEVVLTSKEMQILIYLANRRGRIISQSELVEHVYPTGEVRESNTIEVYIGRLRRKLGKDVIRTIRGLGYKTD